MPRRLLIVDFGLDGHYAEILSRAFRDRVHRLKQKVVEAKGRGESVWITIK